MVDFGAFLVILIGFIGCFVILPFWIGSGMLDVKNKKEEIRELQEQTLNGLENYKYHMSQLYYNINKRVNEVQDLIKELQVPLEKYVYKNLFESNLKDNIQDKFENIERKLKYQLEQDMCEIKHKVNEVVVHFEKDDRRRLIEYVEKSFETDGKQILLERLKNK